jgi:hypothetical protein
MKVQFSPEAEFQASEKVYRGSCFTNSIVFMGGNALNGVLFFVQYTEFSVPDPYPKLPKSYSQKCDGVWKITFSELVYDYSHIFKISALYLKL